MKRLFIVTVLALCSFCAFAVPKKDETVKKTVEVATFSELDVSGAFEVAVQQGESCILEIEADEEIYSRIKIETGDGKLKVFIENVKFIENVNVKKNIVQNKKGRLHVTAKSLKKIKGSGAVSYRLEKNSFQLEKIKLSGSSSFSGQIKNAGDTGFEISGASRLDFEVEASKVDIGMSGASSMNGQVKAHSIELDISGASSLKLDVETEKIEAEVSGASSVTLSGNAKTQKFEASGASSIKAENLKGDTASAEASGASKVRTGTNTVTTKTSGAAKVN